MEQNKQARKIWKQTANEKRNPSVKEKWNVIIWWLKRRNVTWEGNAQNRLLCILHFQLWLSANHIMRALCFACRLINKGQLSETCLEWFQWTGNHSSHGMNFKKMFGAEYFVVVGKLILGQKIGTKNGLVRDLFFH